MAHCPHRAALLCTTALVPLLLGGPATAQGLPRDARPQGGQVVAGSASIRQDPALTRVDQASNRAILDWRSFNVGADHTVQFRQPSASAMTLNRVTGPDPSVIAGRITANGQVALVNQSGVVFSQGSRVEAQSLVVSTADIANQAFMAGGSRLAFDRPGKPDARIENRGSITVRETGLAALVAPQVANQGVIRARLGRVVLAGAETHAIDLHGDGLLSLEVTGPVRRAPANGGALVSNTGSIEAPGGTVHLTAAAVDGIVQNLVRAGGRIAADTDAATGRTGRVLVSGTGGAVRIEGEVTARGTSPGTRGGTVEVLGDRVWIADGARVDASGTAGGGAVAIGTTRPGAARPRLARRTGIAPTAVVRADATAHGDGGEVRVNSADYTVHAGQISARGGPQGGNGGFVEVSGQHGFMVPGSIDVGAPRGQPGTVLFDPTDLSIVADNDPRLNVDPNLYADGVLGANEGPTTAFIGATTVGNTFSFLRLEASQDLSVLAGVFKFGGGLDLVAGRTLTVAAPIQLNGTGSNLTLAGTTIVIDARVQVPTTGQISLVAGSGGIQQTAGLSAGRLVVTSIGDVALDLIGTETNPGNAIDTLGPSNVTGAFRLTSAPLTQFNLNLDGDIQAGSLTLRQQGGIAQNEGSRLLVGTLDATATSLIDLSGANQIAVVQQLAAGSSIGLFNATSLRLAGPVTAGSNTVTSIDVSGGDLDVGGIVSAGAGVSLRASGNLRLAAGSNVFADDPFGIPLLRLRGGHDFTGEATAPLPGGLTLAGAVGNADGSNAIELAGGLGGIQQTAGRLVGRNLALQSASDIILDRGGSQAGLPNAVTGGLPTTKVPGDFVFDNGNTDIRLDGATITAAIIGLRTQGALVIGPAGCVPSCSDAPSGLDAGVGQVSLRIGSLARTDATRTIRGGVVEIAPATAVELAVPVATAAAGSLILTPADLAAIQAATLLRLGATTFRGTTATTAAAVRIGAPLGVANALDLRSLGDITQVAGADLSAGSLTFAAGGQASLANPGNQVANLGDASGGLGLAFRNAAALNLIGLMQSPGTVALTVAGDLLATGAGRITAGLLTLQTTGAVSLTGANAITALGPATLGGDLALANTTGLTLAGRLDATGHAVALDIAGQLGQVAGGTVIAASLAGRATLGATLDAGTNQLQRIEGFDANGGDFRLVNATALLAVPAGRTVTAGGRLEIANAGDLLIDGTVTGASTNLAAGGTLTVNGFSAIARATDLLLSGDTVVVTGLISAARNIRIEATQSAQLSGRASAPAGRLAIAAPLIGFGGLAAGDTPVRLLLGTAGTAAGSLDAQALEVAGGAGTNLAGTIAAVAGGPAAAIGRRIAVSGAPLANPPQPTAFLFNGCPIGVPLCGAVPVVTNTGPPPVTPNDGPPPVATSDRLPPGTTTIANNPREVIRVLDPAAVAAQVAATRPPLPALTTSIARDRSEDDALAPPNVRGGDY